MVLVGCGGDGGEATPLVDVGTLRFASAGSGYAGDAADLLDAKGYGAADGAGFEFWVTAPDAYGNYGAGRLLRVRLPRASFGPFDLASSREASVVYVEGRETGSPTVQLESVRVRQGSDDGSSDEANAVTIDGAVVLSTAPAPV